MQAVEARTAAVAGGRFDGRVFRYHHVEQRIAGRMRRLRLFAAELLVDARKWKAAVPQALRQRVLHGGQRLFRRGVAGDRAGQRQHVDEVADLAGLVFRVARGRGGAEHEAGAAAAALHFDAHQCQHQRMQAGALAARKAAQAGGGSRIEMHAQGVAAPGLGGGARQRPREIERPFIEGAAIAAAGVQLLLPVARIGVAIGAGQIGFFAAGAVRGTVRRGRQAVAGQQRAQFARQQAQRHAVADRVVQAEPEHRLAVRLRQAGAPQGRCRHVESLALARQDQGARCIKVGMDRALKLARRVLCDDAAQHAILVLAKAAAQRRVAQHQAVPGIAPGFRRGAVVVHGQRQRDIEAARIEACLLGDPEFALAFGGAVRQQGRRRRARGGRLKLAQARRQRVQGRRGEQFARRDGMAEFLLQLLRHRDRQQAVAAQGEEIVVAVDGFLVQQRAPDARHRGFGFALRQFASVGLAARRQHGAQRRLVHLAGGVERNGGQRQQGRGQHVGRQVACQEGAPVGIGRQLRARLQAGEGPQHMAAAIAFDQAGRLRDCRMAAQRMFDLAQFDADAVQLDLVVAAAEDFQLARRIPARQVAAAVAPSMRRLDKGGGRQLRAVQVGQGQAGAAQPQLAAHARRQRLARRTADMGAGIGQRCAARQPGAVGAGQLRHAAGDGVFGRAIGVEIRQPFAVQRHVARERRFAARYQCAQRRQRLAVEQAQIGGREVGHADFQFGQQARDLARRVEQGRWQRAQCRANSERHADIGQRDVERGRREEQGAVAGGQSQAFAAAEHGIDQRGMADHGAFRRAGRARGVDDIGCCIGLHARAGRLVARERAQRAHMRGQAGRRRMAVQQQQQVNAGVARHKGQPFGRQVGRQRQIGGAGLPQAQQGAGQLARAPCQHADPLARSHAGGEQLAGDAIGLFFQRAIREVAAIGAQHGRARGLRGAALVQQGLEPAVEAHGRAGLDGAVFPALQQRLFGRQQVRQRRLGMRRIGRQPVGPGADRRQPGLRALAAVQHGVDLPLQQQAAVGQGFVGQHHVLARRPTGQLVVDAVAVRPATQQRFVFAGGGVFADGQVEQRVARRMAVFGMGFPEIVVHAGKRIARVLQRRAQAVLGGAQQFAEAGAGQQAAGQRQHVDVVAGEAGLERRFAGGGGGAEHEVCARGTAPHFQRKQGQHHGMQAGLMAARQRLQGLPGSCAEPALEAVAARVEAEIAWMVERPFVEGAGGQPCQRGAPPGFIVAAGGAGQIGLFQRRRVAERRCQRGQFAPLQQRAQFLLQDAQRLAVADRVVHRQPEQGAAVIDGDQAGAPQRRLGHRQRRALALAHMSQRGGRRRDPDVFQRLRHLRHDIAAQLAVRIFLEAGAQRVVAF